MGETLVSQGLITLDQLRSAEFGRAAEAIGSIIMVPIAEELAFREAQLASLHGRPKQPRARARVLHALLPFTLRSTRK